MDIDRYIKYDLDTHRALKNSTFRCRHRRHSRLGGKVIVPDVVRGFRNCTACGICYYYTICNVG